MKCRKTICGGNGVPNTQGQVNHEFFLGNDLGTPSESSQMVARVAVIVFNINRMGFADNMAFRRQNIRESIPVVSVKGAVFQMLYFVIESPKGCRITTAEHPGHGSPCATVNGFDNPKLSFFEPRKCHISSNSICVISPDTSGSGKLSPYARIHRYTRV